MKLKNLVGAVIAITSTTLSAEAGIANGYPKNCFDLNAHRSLQETLDAVMSKSNGNLSIQSSVEGLDTSLLTLRSSQAAFIPSLTITNTYEYFDDEYQYSYSSDPYQAPTSDWYGSNNNDLSVGVSWLIFDMPSIYTIKGSKSDYESEKYNLATDIQSNSEAAANALLDYIYYLNLLENNRKMSSIHSKIFSDAKLLNERGQTSRIELLQSTQQRDSYRSNVLSTQTQVENALFSLETYLGVDVCKNSEESIQLIKNSLEYTSYDEAISKAISVSPSLRSLKKQIDSTIAQSSYYKSLTIPSISLGATASLESDYQSNPTNSTNITNDYSLDITVSLSLDAADIYSAKAMTKKADSLNKSLLFQEEKMRNDLKGLMTTMPKLNKSIEFADHSLKSQEEISSLTMIGYKAGYKSSTDLYVANDNLYDSLNQLLTSRYNYLKNILAYESYLLFPSYPKTSEFFDRSD
jgi:outer membrane protein TolC